MKRDTREIYSSMKKESVIDSFKHWCGKGDYSMSSYILRAYYFGRGTVDSLFPPQYFMKWKYDGQFPPYTFCQPYGIIHFGKENRYRELVVIV